MDWAELDWAEEDLEEEDLEKALKRLARLKKIEAAVRAKNEETEEIIKKRTGLHAKTEQMVELEKKRDPMWEDRSYDYKSKRCNEMLQEMVDLRKLEKKRDPMWEDRRTALSNTSSRGIRRCGRNSLSTTSSR